MAAGVVLDHLGEDTGKVQVQVGAKAACICTNFGVFLDVVIGISRYVKSTRAPLGKSGGVFVHGIRVFTGT